MHGTFHVGNLRIGNLRVERFALLLVLLFAWPTIVLAHDGEAPGPGYLAAWIYTYVRMYRPAEDLALYEAHGEAWLEEAAGHEAAGHEVTDGH